EPRRVRRSQARDAARPQVRGLAADPRRPHLARPLRPPRRSDRQAARPGPPTAVPGPARAQGVVRRDRYHQGRGAGLVAGSRRLWAYADRGPGPALLGPYPVGSQPPALERLDPRRPRQAPLLRGRYGVLRRAQGDRRTTGPVRRRRDSDRRLPAARDYEVGPPAARAAPA